MTNTGKFWLFTALVLSFSGLLWGSLAVFRFEVPNLEEGGAVRPLPMTFYVLNGFMPSIIGVVMYRLYERRTWKRELRTIIPKKAHLKIYTEILVLFSVMVLMQFMLYHVFVSSFDFSVITAQILQLIPLIILGPLSEEIGWRGFLEKQADGVIPEMQKPLIIGIIWALWHLPLFFILGTTQQSNSMSFLTFTVLIILLSIIMSYYRERTGHAIFTGIFIHYLYTVGLTFYILGSTYSLYSDLLTMIPFLLVGGYLLHRMKRKRVA